MRLEQKSLFRALMRKRRVLGFLAALVSYGMLYFVLSFTNTPVLDSSWGMSFGWAPWVGDSWWRLLLIFGFVFLSTIAANGSLTEGEEVCQLYPSPEKEQPKVRIPEHLSLDLIVSMTLELAEEMNVTVSGIYVGDSPVPNAFTTFAVEKGNIVFLNSNLLEIMDEESIRAVIAHELGHIKNSDVWFQIGVSIPKQIMRLWLLLFLVQVFGVALLSTGLWMFAQRMLLVVGVLFFYVICEFIVEFASNSYSQTKEKMADAYAVQHTSLEGMINGFLRLNDRSYTLQLLISALKKEDEDLDEHVLSEALRLFPVGSKETGEIVDQAYLYYAQAQLNLMLKRLRVELPSETKKEWLDEMLVHQKETEETKKEETQESEDEQQEVSPFVWQDFDWNHDGILQKEEIVGLRKSLEDNPKALTDEEGDSGSHPSVRARILFLTELFKDELPE